MRSAKVFIAVFTGKGGGLSSIDQKRFLANPCFSRFPCVPNCIYVVLSDDWSRHFELIDLMK